MQLSTVKERHWREKKERRRDEGGECNGGNMKAWKGRRVEGKWRIENVHREERKVREKKEIEDGEGKKRKTGEKKG